MNRAKLCSGAQRKTGLQDFGDPDLEPAFSILLNSLQAEAELHPLGRFLMRIHLRGLLETRLRLLASWEKHLPAIENTPLERPIFIVGMPRSGSTFLHELLGEDPALRAPRVWEVMFPTLGNAPVTDDQNRRIGKTETCLWWFRKLARKADSVYPMRARTPHECVAIHSYTFLSEEFVSTCRIPTYEKFLRSVDRTSAYRWQKRFLQALQHRDGPTRWILKSPDHVHSLEALFCVFPDAFIIQTHRNPFDVLRSSTELTRVLQGLYAWAAEPDEMATRETRVLAEGTERLMRFRDAHPELGDRFVDVKYTDFVSDPLAAVSGIYRALHLPFSEHAAYRMRQLASRRSRYHGVGPHAASATAGAPGNETRLRQYCSRFDLQT